MPMFRTNFAYTSTVNRAILCWFSAVFLQNSLTTPFKEGDGVVAAKLIQQSLVHNYKPLRKVSHTFNISPTQTTVRSQLRVRAKYFTLLSQPITELRIEVPLNS